MCVILIAKDVRPNDRMVDLAWKRNSHGGGLAWREKDEETGKVVVRWKKGIDSVEEMWAEMEDLPLPYVAHFRIASSGGVRKDLCHPFPVCESAPLALEGTTEGSVLFHNGDWKDWADYVRYVAPSARAQGIQLPKGKLNDTRAMAWLTHVMGDSFLELLPSQRGVLFGPKSFEIFVGSGWAKINDVWCSNDGFWSAPHQQSSNNHQQGANSAYKAPAGQKYGPMCSVGECRTRVLIGATGKCDAHQTKSPRDNSAAQGVSAKVTPFPQGRMPLISRDLAEKLCPSGKDKKSLRRISKNLKKRILEAHDRIENPLMGQKQVASAIKDLELASAIVFSQEPTLTSSGLPA